MKESHLKLIKAYNKGYRINEEGIVTNPKGNITNGVLTDKGYRYAGVRFGNKTYKMPFHRLQAYQKFGDKIFEEGIHVRHLNNVSTDNSYINIGIGTAKENEMDKDPEVRRRSAIIAASYVRKYDKAEVQEFYKKHGWGKTLKQFSISSNGTLSYIINT